MSSEKQLKAMASEERREGGREGTGVSGLSSSILQKYSDSPGRGEPADDSPSSRMTRRGARRSHMPCTYPMSRCLQI